MIKLRSLITLLLLPTLFTSCLLSNESPLATSSDNANLIQSGDIIVANTGNDSIILLTSNGTYKTTLYDEITSGNILFGGLAYDTLNKQVIWNYDHATALLDAVKAFSLYDGAITTVLSNSNLQGTMPGLARLTGGQLAVLENTTTVEEFSSAGVRVWSSPKKVDTFLSSGLVNLFILHRT